VTFVVVLVPEVAPESKGTAEFAYASPSPIHGPNMQDDVDIERYVRVMTLRIMMSQVALSLEAAVTASVYSSLHLPRSHAGDDETMQSRAQSVEDSTSVDRPRNFHGTKNLEC
jgi:hypothetical protein